MDESVNFQFRTWREEKRLGRESTRIEKTDSPDFAIRGQFRLRGSDLMGLSVVVDRRDDQRSGQGKRRLPGRDREWQHVIQTPRTDERCERQYAE